MIKFDIITIFPEMFKSYLSESLISRAQEKKFIKVSTHHLREFADDARGTVDDRPFGGGLGMVLKVEPIYKAVKKIHKSKKSKVIVFTPRGQKFTQTMAHKLSKLDQIVFICGRYEGVDQRVGEKIADMEISIGDYDLMGGELPAMVAIETISRLIPGVLRQRTTIKREDYQKRGIFRICPVYPARSI
jgi:tRNA (guanine37-N1)-methyltransferase